MQLLSPGTTCTSNEEMECAQALTMRQKLALFWGLSEDGSQLVEMAMVFPIMLVLLTGMASFGMALYSQQQLGLAAASAVQLVSLDTSQISDPCSTIATSITTSLPTPAWTAANFNYTLTVYSSTSTSNQATGSGTTFSCKSLNADLTAFQPIVLTVSYKYTWFPVMSWAAWGSTAKPSGSLSTTQAAMIQ